MKTATETRSVPMIGVVSRRKYLKLSAPEMKILIDAQVLCDAIRDRVQDGDQDAETPADTAWLGLTELLGTIKEYGGVDLD